MPEQPKCRNCGKIKSEHHNLGNWCLPLKEIHIIDSKFTFFEPLTTNPTKGGDDMQPPSAWPTNPDGTPVQQSPEPSNTESVGAESEVCECGHPKSEHHRTNNEKLPCFLMINGNMCRCFDYKPKPSTTELREAIERVEARLDYTSMINRSDLTLILQAARKLLC